MLCFPVALSLLWPGKSDHVNFLLKMFSIFLLLTKTTFLGDVWKAFHVLHVLVSFNICNLVPCHFAKHSSPSCSSTCLCPEQAKAILFLYTMPSTWKYLFHVYLYSLQSTNELIFLLRSHPWPFHPSTYPSIRPCFCHTFTKCHRS